MTHRKCFGLIGVIMLWPAVAAIKGCCGPGRCFRVSAVITEVYNNGGAEPVEMGSGGRVRSQALLIRLDLVDTLMFEGYCRAAIAGVAPSATATSCDDEDRRTADVATITITSTAAVDSTHPPGTDLGDYFVTKRVNKRDYLYDLDYYWRPEVPLEGRHQFTVFVTLTDSSKLQASTPSIEIFR